jgi:hypothetical protein
VAFNMAMTLARRLLYVETATTPDTRRAWEQTFRLASGRRIDRT